MLSRLPSARAFLQRAPRALVIPNLTVTGSVASSKLVRSKVPWQSQHLAESHNGQRFFCAPSSWLLPEVPQDVQDAIGGGAVVQELVPREAVLIDSRVAAEDCLPDLLASKILGVDCEGVALGRWGRLCLCQIATVDRVYLFDALRSGVMEAIRPAFTSPGVIKVMHDCREDASALLSQFNISLENVFDTQVAHTMLLEHESTRPFQISLNELLKLTLQLRNEKQLPLVRRMTDDPNIWFYRPMHADLTAYAAQDVMYLPLLQHRLCDLLRDLSGGGVLERSRRYVEYARMNLHLASPKAAERRGLRLQAMLATQTEAAHYFKLNLGAHRQGVVSRADALSRFQDLQFGDTADCWVSAWNQAGNVVFLERVETGAFRSPDVPNYASPRPLRRGGRRPRSQVS